MKVITLRNIPKELRRAIQERAQEAGSLSQAVISLLRERISGPPCKPVRQYHDLDKLAGRWTAQEAREFEQALAEQRKIDPDLWRK